MRQPWYCWVVGGGRLLGLLCCCRVGGPPLSIPRFAFGPGYGKVSGEVGWCCCCRGGWLVVVVVYHGPGALPSDQHALLLAYLCTYSDPAVHLGGKHPVR